MISVVFADSCKGCPYDFVFQFVADDAHIVQNGFLHYSPAANWFVGDAEPYGFAVNLCVYGCNILPVCLSILRHGSAVPPPFLRRPTKQLPVALAPLAKELPVGLRIDNIIK